MSKKNLHFASKTATKQPKEIKGRDRDRADEEMSKRQAGIDETGMRCRDNGQSGDQRGKKARVFGVRGW